MSYLLFSTVLLLLHLLQSSGSELLNGTRIQCLYEEAPISMDERLGKGECYHCVCRNGYVECNSHCPSVEGCHMVVSEHNGCCPKICKGCFYKGKHYLSHDEWTDPDDPCTVVRCEAGVITESNSICHVPCDNPIPPAPGKCCPTCPECKINGQIVYEDRDVISDDPCVKCRCTQGKLICSKKACPVLQCTRFLHTPGECCPHCVGNRPPLNLPRRKCMLKSAIFKEGQQFAVDKWTKCTCQNETSICKRTACPVLDCTPDLQQSVPNSHCKVCMIDEVKTTCSYSGEVFEDGHSWKMDACSSCECHQGKVKCAKTRCNNTAACAPGARYVHVKGECCPKCQEVEGSCMVFGDPHYKTFDGKIFSFKGVGKYQLVSDCVNKTFFIKVANMASNKLTSYTKRVAIKYENDIRINLQQKGRVKLNGKQLGLPYFNKTDKVRRIERIEGNVELLFENGLKIFWNGKSFLEVLLPASFKNKVCGLCGNFNGNAKDDLMMRGGRVVEDTEINQFGASWCVKKDGKRSECGKKIKPVRFCAKAKPEKKCKYFESEPFRRCISKLNYSKYLRTCKMDMCHCPSGKCYCESLMAYARECKGLGVGVVGWEQHTDCAPSLKKPKQGRKTHSLPAKFYRTSFPSNLTLHRKGKAPILIE